MREKFLHTCIAVHFVARAAAEAPEHQSMWPSGRPTADLMVDNNTPIQSGKSDATREPISALIIAARNEALSAAAPSPRDVTLYKKEPKPRWQQHAKPTDNARAASIASYAKNMAKR